MSHSFRISTALGAGLTLAFASGTVHSEDLGYRYNTQSQLCVNDKGQTGHNPDFMGECGFLKDKDLTWANLTFPWEAMPGAILDGANLYGAVLTTLNLSGASLQNADFHLANLSEANLSYANLVGSKLGNSHFSQTNLSNAKLSGLDLSDTNVRMANFTDADLTAVSFRGNENMHQAKFDGATLEQANLQGAYLYGASFRRASLGGADFSHSQLLGADLTDADAEETLFKEASYNEDTLLPFSQEEAIARGMRLVSDPASAGKVIAITGNSDGSCAPKEIHLMRGEKVIISFKGDPAIMFLLTIPDFQIELMTMGADAVKKPYTPNQTGTFKFTCGPHGASDDKQTHGTIMVM